jgi:hypothetical protein
MQNFLREYLDIEHSDMTYKVQNDYLEWCEESLSPRVLERILNKAIHQWDECYGGHKSDIIIQIVFDVKNYHIDPFEIGKLYKYIVKEIDYITLLESDIEGVFYFAIQKEYFVNY